MKAETELTIVPRNTLPMVIGKLPPRPVWDEQIAAFLQKANFVFSATVCKSKEDVDVCKTLSSEGVTLKTAIEESYTALTRAIDAIKQPIIDQRKQDVAKVQDKIDTWDIAAKTWIREEERKAQAEADRKRQEEYERRKAKAKQEAEEAEKKRKADIELAKDWGDEEKAAALEAEPPPVIPEVQMPRASKVEIGVTYRKGARTKVTYVFQIEDPDKVTREHCMPDLKLINAKVKNFFNLILNPTPEQIKELEEKIGGGKIVEE